MKKTLILLVALLACAGLVLHAGALTGSQTTAPEAADDGLYVAKLLGLDYVSIVEPNATTIPLGLCTAQNTEFCVYEWSPGSGCCVPVNDDQFGCQDICR